jgi:hypothetical protein
MAALNFPNPPLTVDQEYSAPNGYLYRWDGEVWTVLRFSALPSEAGYGAGGYGEKGYGA